MAADIFDEPFNGPSLEPVTGMTQTKGGAVQLLYGIPAQELIPEGVSGADIRYAHNNSPGTRSYRVRVRASYSNPGGTGHILRAFARYDRADKNGYYVELNSGVGSPTLKLYRLVNGTPTQLGSTFNPFALVADTDYTIEVECDGTVIRAYWNGNDDPDSPDIEATDSNVYTQGYAGVGTENAVQTGGGTIKIKHLEVNTPHSSGVAPPSPTGLLLKVDGIEYDEDALQENNLQIQQLIKSIVAVDSLTFIQKTPFTAPLFRPEQVVELFVDIASVRTRVFHGKIRNRPGSGTGKAELIKYTALGYRANWQYVKIRHPQTLSPQLVWNALQRDPNTEEQDPDFDKDYANLTVGKFLEKVIDDNQDKIHQYFGSDPKDGQPSYAENTLNGLTLQPAKKTMRGNLDAMVNEALGLMPTRALVFDYDLGQFVVRDLTTLSAKDVSFTGKRVPRVEITLDTTKVFTAARVTGVSEEMVEETGSFKGGDFNKLWDQNLESEWTQERAKRRVFGYSVQSVVIGGGPAGRDKLIVTRGANAEKVFNNEWKGTTLEVRTGAAAGEKFQVFSNTGQQPDGTYEFIIAGNFVGAIGGGDTIWTTDNMKEPTTNNRNGFFYVYRAFKLNNDDQIAKDACAKFQMKYDIGDEDFKDGGERKAAYGDLPKNETGGNVALADSPMGLPEVGLVNWTDNSGECGVQEDRTQGILDKDGDIEFEYSYKKITVAQTRYPSDDTAWYGPAFSGTAAKWGVAGAVPDGDDLGVMREEDLEDANFKYQVQKADWDAILTERVKATSVMPWGGTIEYRGLDWDNILFEKKLTLSSGQRTTGWESEDLIPISWTWDFPTNKNMVEVGTLSIFAREIEKAKQTSRLDSTLKAMEYKIEQFRQMQECQVKGQPNRDGSDPNPVGSGRVKSGSNTSQSDTNKTSDHGTVHSTFGKKCTANCRKWACVTADNPDNFEKNAALLESFDIESIVPLGWVPGGGRLSVHHAVEVIRHVLACTLHDIFGVFASQDVELAKAQIDMHTMGDKIGKMMLCLMARDGAILKGLNKLIIRVNSLCWCLLYNDFKLAYCLSSKIDGPGAYCDVNLECCEDSETVTIGGCEFKFNPKVCDDADCKEKVEQIKLADVPTPR